MKYLLTIQVKIDAIDDMEAKQRTYEILKSTKIDKISQIEEDLDFRLSFERSLQEIETNKLPRKITI